MLTPELERRDPRTQTDAADSLHNEALTNVLVYPSGNPLIQSITARVKAKLFSSHDTAAACHTNVRYVIPKASILVASRCSLGTKNDLILPSARNTIQSRLTISARRSVQQKMTSVLRTLFLFRRMLCYFRALLTVTECPPGPCASCRELRIIRNKYPSGRRTNLLENMIHSHAPPQNLFVCLCVCVTPFTDTCNLSQCKQEM